MATTHLMYYSALLGQWNGTVNGVFDLDSDTIKMSAHTNTYAPNRDTHDFWNDVTNEVSGGGYTSGGETMTGLQVMMVSGTVTFDVNDVVWQRSATGFMTARKFVIYRSTGTPSTSRLFSIITLDADVGNANLDLVLRAA